MVELTLNWNGRVLGTNTGNVAVSLDGQEEALTGLIRLNDDNHGVVVYKVSGTFIQGKLELEGAIDGDPEEGVEYGTLTVAGSLTAQGRLEGNWSTTVGTGGTFLLHPHFLNAKEVGHPSIPEQLNTTARTIGAVRLYAEDVSLLISNIVRDFNQKRAIVNYVERGTQKNLYADEFIEIMPGISDLNYLKISVSEPEMYGLNRTATVELTAWGDNTVRIESVQEAWALGKAESLSQQMEQFQRQLATQFRKFGLTVNVAITIVALAALPGLPTFGRRLFFAASAFAVQALVTYFHRKYIANFVLYSAKTKPGLLMRFWPGITSWSITIFGGVVAAVIYGLLKGELTESPLLNFVRTLIQ